MTRRTTVDDRRRTFLVSFELPERATLLAAEAYIKDAVGTMRGCYRPPGTNGDDDPGHPMWPLTYEDVQVRAQPVARRTEGAVVKIVAAYVTGNATPETDLPRLITSVHDAIAGLVRR